MRQLLVEQEALRRAHLPVQRLGQLRPLGAQLAQGQLGHGRRIRLPGHQGCQHGPSGLPQHIRGHTGQLDVDPLQQLLDAIDHSRPLLHEGRAVAGGLAQVALGARRDETGAQQAQLHTLAQPLGILGIGFAARHMLDVLGIDQPDRKLAFQQVEDRLPIVPGRLERHVGHTPLMQPVHQLQEIGGHGAEGAQCADSFVPRSRLGAAGHDRLLMHVQPGTLRKHDAHASPLSRLVRSGARSERNYSTCSPCGGDNRGCRRVPRSD